MYCGYKQKYDKTKQRPSSEPRKLKNEVFGEVNACQVICDAFFDLL